MTKPVNPIAASVVWCQKLRDRRAPAEIDRATVRGLAATLTDIDRCCLVYASRRGTERCAPEPRRQKNTNAFLVAQRYLASVNL